MENKMLDVLSIVMGQIKEELSISENIFTDDNFRKAIDVNNMFRIMMREQERDYFNLRVRLSQVDIDILKHNSGNGSVVCNIANTLNNAVKILDELKNINVTVRDRLVAHGIIYDYKTMELLDKIRRSVKTLTNKTKVINPFIVYDKPTKMPFMNGEYLIDKLQSYEKIITRPVSNQYGNITEDMILLVCDIVSGKPFKQITREADLSSKAGLEMVYSIKILDDSDAGKIFHKYKNDHRRLRSLTSIIGWDLFTCNITPEEGIILTLKIDDKYCSDSSLDKDMLC